MVASADPPAQWTSPSGDQDRPAVLVVADFTPNLGKVERHVGPLTETARPTMVCLTPADVPDIEYRLAPSPGWRPVGLCLLFFVALHEAWRGEYDAVVSFSLIPHGTFALIVGRLSGCPVHVGVIGADVDVHARSRYGPLISALLRRFDVVSVPGQQYRRELVAQGLQPDQIAILRNPIDVERYGPADADIRYDLLWVGRFSSEKDPLLFVECCRRLQDGEIPFTAAMVGDGPLFDDVRERLAAYGLDERVRLPGWVDDPIRFYQQSSIFVLTSERDALPLTLLEAMATGCAPVVPRIGNVTDVARDGQNAVVLDRRSAGCLATAMERLLDRDDLTRRLGRRAQEVRRTHSLAAARRDWNHIVDHMLAQPRDHPPMGADEPTRDRGQPDD